MKTYLNATGWTGFNKGKWSNLADIVSNPSDEIIVDYKVKVNTLSGNDKIYGGGGGIGRFGTGVMLKGGAELNTGAGNDTIEGYSQEGHGIYNDGKILTGDGDDLIRGSGGYIGISSNGLALYDLGTGNDTFYGVGVVWGIYVNKLLAGTGNDLIMAEARQTAIEVRELDAGDGDDRIIGRGGTLVSGDPNALGVGISCNTLITGKGNDVITGINVGEASIRFGMGIWLQRPQDLIDTGDGNDTIIGSSFGGRDINSGIDNDGIIRTGSGEDTLNALSGGFTGAGIFDLGSDNDTLIGYGVSSRVGGPGFLGGSGIDKILLGAGTYQITSGMGFDSYNIRMISGVSAPVGSVMSTSSFELIGSEGSLLTTDIRVGTLLISSSGTVGYL